MLDSSIMAWRAMVPPISGHYRYYIDQAWQGKYVSLRVDAAKRVFVVEEHERLIKQVPIKGLLGEVLALDTYVKLMAHAARTQAVGGRPIGQQLRLPLEIADTSPTAPATM